MRWLLPIALAFVAGLAVLSGGGGAPAPAAVQRPVLTGTSADIPALQSAVRKSPEREDLRVSLAAAYLQRVRETGDPSFYARAEGVLQTPRSADALATAGELALARHDFGGALGFGRRAGAVGAFVRVDALVELGRYGAAERELQRMVDRKPNLAAYARVSYLRELRGDLAGAAGAMRLAVAAGGPAPENNAYVSALLGELERRRGRTAAARRAFERALASVPRFAAAEAGLARLDAERAAAAVGRHAPHRGSGAPTTPRRPIGAATGRPTLHRGSGAHTTPRRPIGAAGRAAARRAHRASISRLRRVVELLPLPEYVVALGETELAAGRTAAGRRDLALVAVEQRLQQAAGVDIDVELAVFEADHGSPRRAVALARRAWDAAPSVRAADALGWALTRSGDPEAGLRWARRALRLGSLDPILRAHAGLSALAAGRHEEGRRQLRIALAHGLDGYPWQARRVDRALR